jgi:hypothetical protein
MKNTWFYSLAILGILLTSCKKDDSNTPDKTTTSTPVPNVPVYGIAKDSTYDGTPANTVVRLFEYNSAKQLVKIRYKYGTSTTYSTDIDSIYYNGSGQPYLIYAVTVNQFGNWYVNLQRNFYYNSDNSLSSVRTLDLNDDTNNDTLTFVYNAGKIFTIYDYMTGSIDTASSIVYTNNNPTSLVYNSEAITINTDATAINPYYGVPDIQKTSFVDFITYNNLTTAYPTLDVNNQYEDLTYTYSNGRVSTIVDNIDEVTTVITYKEL